jgi:hypothetical protein
MLRLDYRNLGKRGIVTDLASCVKGGRRGIGFELKQEGPEFLVALHCAGK